MRKISLCFATALAGVGVFLASGSAGAIEFNNDACLDLSQIETCENHVNYGFVKAQGPTLDPCGMPWVAVVRGSC
ncbi:hypothetical protein HUT18_15300 [Streptomyces sp. NA04227]|uniref:hypothetical protein n=1 Tax=Streptomyces sp. NA04227 TaxID=2742136 RepID=UPI00159056CB|nr:hypothetical protein [Streptomyces sp. NA04227]QKW07545.1 hypothetical protein HUT18_15300 [Streptomyces sp. NA04227]